jgi:hypothetical protein
VTMDDGQLMAERDVFQMQRGARLDDTSQRVEQRNDDGRHDCRLSENAWNINPRNTYEVLGRHTALCADLRPRSKMERSSARVLALCRSPRCPDARPRAEL